MAYFERLQAREYLRRRGECFDCVSTRLSVAVRIVVAWTRAEAIAGLYNFEISTKAQVTGLLIADRRKLVTAPPLNMLVGLVKDTINQQASTSMRTRIVDDVDNGTG